MYKGPEQTFLKRRHTNGQQVHKKVLDIREMRTKTMVRYRLARDFVALIRLNQGYSKLNGNGSLGVPPALQS